MTNRIIVDNFEGTFYIYTDNGGNTLQIAGEALMEHAAEELVVDLIGQTPGNVLTDLDVVEINEVLGGKEYTSIVKMTEYLEK